MKNSVFIGMAIGLVAGACLINNSQKAKRIVDDAQDQLKTALCKGGRCKQGGRQSSEDTSAEM